MHVQTDFVTNSSSTAYIIFVPDSFYVSDKHIDKALQGCKINFGSDFEISDEQLKEVAEVVEMMKNGERYDWEYTDNLWTLCFEIFGDEGFVVDGIELDDGNTTMKGIEQKTIISTITDHVDLDDLVKTLVKGANDERQDQE